MTCSRPLEVFNSVVAGLNKEFKSMYCTEDNMGKFFIRLTNRLGIYKPITGVEIYTTTVGHHVCARNDNKEPLVEFTVDPNATRHIGRVTVYSNNLMAFITNLMKEETTMKELEGFSIPGLIEDGDNGYVPFLEIVGKMAEGDIIESASGKAIMKELDKYFWCEAATGETSNIVELRGDVIQLKFRFYIPYVGWREAFEAYENGHSIECEYNGEMIWFNRNNVTLEESSMLADKQLDGLLTTKWIIKERNRK